MTTLRDALADYLRIRRRLGFEMPQDGRLLEGFVEFLERAGAERITTELALKWARLPVHAHPHRWRQRLSVARGFARHLATVDPASEVPSKDLLPATRPRIAPYIYTDGEIAALMAAAGELRPRLRAARHQTLIGLLAVTGILVGEAVGLDVDDVDLDSGVIWIRETKYHKARRIPVQPTTVAALRRYSQLRQHLCPRPTVPCFFVSSRAGRITTRRHNRVPGDAPRLGAGDPHGRPAGRTSPEPGGRPPRYADLDTIVLVA